MRYKDDVLNQLDNSEILVDNIESTVKGSPSLGPREKERFMHFTGSLKKAIRRAAQKVDLEPDTF